VSDTPLPPPRDLTSDSGALLELSTLLNTAVELDVILGNVLLSCMGKLMASRGIVLVASTEGVLDLRVAKGVDVEPVRRSFSLPAEWNLPQEVDRMLTHADAEVRDFAACCTACGIVLVIPLLLDGRMTGLLGLGARLTRRAYEAPELTFLDSVAAVAATAVHNARTVTALRALNRRLDAKVQEMNTLFELSREMNRGFDESQILRLLGYALMGQMRVMRYGVLAADGDVLHPVLLKLPAYREDAVMQECLAQLHGAVSAPPLDAHADDLRLWMEACGVRVAIPMRVQDETRGVLLLGERLGADGYEDTDIDYLTALANISITAIENARLVFAMIEKQRLEQEMAVAKTIQQGLLPARIHQPAGYDIAAVNDSSLQVGGDYYDVVPLSDQRFILAIGDVAGKGMPAALLMASVQASLRTLVPLDLPLAESTARMNAVIYQNTGQDKFITFFWGVLDTAAHTLTYVNAGHNPPYLLRADGCAEPLSAGGLILGVLDPAPPYESGTVTFETGDTLVAYTDGVNEAMSRNHEEYGDERLRALLRTLRALPASEIVDAVRGDIAEFTAGAAQSDDITLLVVHRTD
jgi:phosphoserine phosphatase RsbU/P